MGALVGIIMSLLCNIPLVWGALVVACLPACLHACADTSPLDRATLGATRKRLPIYLALARSRLFSADGTWSLALFHVPWPLARLVAARSLPAMLVLL